jgi:hypothetical protein
MTPHLARLIWWRLMMEDERWHGVEEQQVGISPVSCPSCKSPHCGHNSDGSPSEGNQVYICAQCLHRWPVEYRTIAVWPTFALLWDREDGTCKACEGTGHFGRYNAALGLVCRHCNGTGKRTIPGHASELAAYLESQGDGRAKAVREIEVRPAPKTGWWEVFPRPARLANYNPEWITYAAACCEAIRCLVDVFTEKCGECAGYGKEYDTECQSTDSWPCEGCFGLGWRVTPPT